MHFLEVAFALLSVAAATPANLFPRTSCSTPDGSGTCLSTSSCGGFSVPGYCPGPADIQCCVSKTCSTPSGSGNCKNTGHGCSGGSFIAGYCPGPSTVECCVSMPSCSTPSGSGTCKMTSSGCPGGSFIPGYCPGPADEQCCVANSMPTCSTPSGSGTCKMTSSGCSGGSFIPGYCPGPADEQCCVPGASGFNAPISRSDIISRGEFWVSRHVPYSQSATYPDPEGTPYRTDCSGFVSMCLHITPTGLAALNTVSLPEVANRITWDELQPGDLVGTLGPGTEGNAGHVTLFHSWVDAATKTEYNSLECNGGDGCVAMQERVGWTDSGFTAEPYRYIHVE